MQKCKKCQVSQEVSGFYPNATPDSWCKRCVAKHREKRPSVKRKAADTREQEQASIVQVVKQFQQNKEPFLYLLSSGGRYKIGFSTNFEHRIKAFNTASPLPHKIIAVAPGGKQQESKLHKALDKYRIFGEWFVRQAKVFELFSKLTGVMVFLPGYISESAPSQPSVEGQQETEIDPNPPRPRLVRRVIGENR